MNTTSTAIRSESCWNESSTSTNKTQNSNQPTCRRTRSFSWTTSSLALLLQEMKPLSFSARFQRRPSIAFSSNCGTFLASLLTTPSWRREDIEDGGDGEDAAADGLSGDRWVERAWYVSKRSGNLADFQNSRRRNSVAARARGIGCTPVDVCSFLGIDNAGIRVVV